MIKSIIKKIITSLFKKKVTKSMDNIKKKFYNVMIPTAKLFEFIAANEEELYRYAHFVYITKFEDKKSYAFIRLQPISLMSN